jgi:hypothetical protein
MEEESLPNFVSNNLKPPIELIEECERQSQLTGDIRFIFDTQTKSVIDKTLAIEISEKRDVIIDTVLDSDEFYISDFSEFQHLPSRFSFYDTETKLDCRWKRYKMATDFLNKLRFSPGIANLGPEFEQSFFIEFGGVKCVIRLKPNLIIYLNSYDYNVKSVVPQTDSYYGFFSKNDILDFLSKKLPKGFISSLVRDLKLDFILED